MQPERALSEAGKVLGELGRQLRAEKKMPTESLREFIQLMKAYSKMTMAVQGKTDKASGTPGLNAKTVDEWIQKHGIPFGYERMVAGSEASEKKRKAK